MWTKDWPIKVGSYWLYGWLHKINYNDSPRLYYVEVRKGKDNLFFVTHGTFIYNDGQVKGLWQKIELPELPSESEIQNL